MAAIGLFVVLVGAADAVSRLSRAFDIDSMSAFAPAVVLFNATSTNPLLGTVHATSTALVPAVLTIPAIGVKADVEKVGKKADGSMDTPTSFDDVAWYSPGSMPGDAGNAVIDGHVNNALTTAGVFQHLDQLAIGDSIVVADSSGKTLSYMVTSVQEYPADSAPAASIFATSGPSQLVLITCDGEWIQDEHQFNKRLVVFARLR